MKIRIASDLHLEALPPEAQVSLHRDSPRGRSRVRESFARQPPAAAFRSVRDRDVLVLAGDIGTHLLARDFVLRELAVSPVIYVPGNHEYYGFLEREQVNADWLALAREHADLHFLVADGVTIDGVRFWGAPWYSGLWGSHEEWAQPAPWLLDVVENYIMDFRHPYNSLNRWTLAAHLEAHRAESVLLAERAVGADVVITHWPPTREAIHPKFDGDALTPYFINDREDLVRALGAKVWISGHMHEAYEYRIGRTLCVGNPTGYRGEPRLSTLFRPDRVVSVAVDKEE